VKKGSHNTAVSEIVGEMLMLTIVLILVAVFAANAGNILPPARDPTVNVIAEGSPGEAAHMNITLYHKGGDWIKKGDLTVVVSWEENMIRFRSDNSPFIMEPDKATFDLGSRITIVKIPANYAKVTLVTPRKVVFSGEVRRE